jgi:hypothetical protein
MRNAQRKRNWTDAAISTKNAATARVRRLTASLPARLVGARWGRPAALGLAVVILVTGLAIMSARYRAFEARGLVGVDYRLFMELGRRWLEDGSMYLQYQLTGPYAFDVGAGGTDVTIMPSLYPPFVGPIFAAWRPLPAAAWWLIPLAILAFAVIRWRPAPWTWPLLSAVLLWPNTAGPLVTGNTTLWIAAGVAGGLLWGWPALLVALKPSFAPFILIGVRRRSWWVGAAVLAGLSMFMISDWSRYFEVVRNTQGAGVLYSLGDLPLAVAPVIAWLGRQRFQEGGRMDHPPNAEPGSI